MRISKKELNSLNLLLFYDNEDVLDIAKSFSEKFCKNPSKNKRKVRLITDLILLLISNGVRNYPDPFQISLSTGLTFKCHYYKYAVLRKVVDFLVEKNVLLYRKGYSFNGNTKNSTLSIAYFFMEAYKEQLATAKVNKKVRRVFIRNKNKDDILEGHTETTLLSQVFLDEYEDFLIKNKVLIGKIPLAVSPIFRIFNNDEDHGGRIYGKWTSLPKKIRGKLTIGGESLAEIDLKACTLTIACHLNNIKVKGDLYSFGIEREVAKKAMLIMLYSQTEIRAKRAIATLGRSKGFEKGYLFSKCMKHLEKTGLKEIMMQGKGLYYIKKEADFCIDLVKICIKYNIVVLCIHDAFLCRKKDINKLQLLIDIVYLKHFRKKPLCHIKL